jgi:hypothetical protein
MANIRLSRYTNYNFLGSTSSSLHNSIWKGWVPPKIKSFTWLALQNRIGGPLRKNRVAKLRTSPTLRTKTRGSVDHLFIHCCFSLHLSHCIKDWLGILEALPIQWPSLTIKHWCSLLTEGAIPTRKATTSLGLLVIWEIWVILVEKPGLKALTNRD